MEIIPEDFGKDIFHIQELKLRYDNKRLYIIKTLNKSTEIRTDKNIFERELDDYRKEIEFLKKERQTLRDLHEILYKLPILNKNHDERQNNITKNKFILVSVSNDNIIPTPDIEDIAFEIKSYDKQILLYNTLIKFVYEVARIRNIEI